MFLSLVTCTISRHLSSAKYNACAAESCVLGNNELVYIPTNSFINIPSCEHSISA